MKFVLNGELVTVLEELAVKNGTSVTTELKIAISDRAFFSEKIHSGSEICLENENGSEKTYVNWR